ncbi:hypothetical protein Xentx_00140 [Xenorhabdus thuongxuanensis]|uniref:Uncharacterized protein n=1 Tax=Xenorhabdus thuongxuanensis TaxID=1873484 RepID=A0A1Q5U9A7_9GAMM|nr:hypothetical protein Xentx_00140 [Xenorhabdus thuongxuanensis]
MSQIAIIADGGQLFVLKWLCLYRMHYGKDCIDGE